MRKFININKGQGFTLIELLVVITIIGILSTMSVVSLNSARQKARDAKRVSDIKQVQLGLELYYNDCFHYPSSANFVFGGSLDSSLDACTSNNHNTYMSQIPTAPIPGVAYTYTSQPVGATGSNILSYNITYTLEGQTGSIPAGAHTATPNALAAN